jgi:flagellin-like hook-associated protein FlgL
MSDIALSAGIRSNLLSLQRTNALLDRTQDRLATGRRVNSAIDDAVAYFQAKTLSERSSDLTARKNEVDQAISALKAAVNGIDGADRVAKQLKGLLTTAKTASAKERAALRDQFNTLAKQLSELVGDASYQGLNLLNSTGSKLTVNFSTNSTSKLDILGRNLRVSKLITGTAAALGSVVATQVVTLAWSVGASVAIVSLFDKGIAILDSAISTLRSAAASLGSNVTFLQTRLDFSKEYVRIMDDGVGKLTLSDINEEGANLVSLQTRQQLGLQALAFAGENERAILQLFR